MKKRALFTAVCTFLICSVFMFAGCQDYVEFFSNDENYIAETGLVKSIGYYPDKEMRLVISYINNGKSKVESFRIIEENEKILRNNNFYEEVRVDCTIVFVTAYKLFGSREKNLYHIFAVEFNGKTYLDFETGKENFLKYIGG